jgi:hypothetical protein
VKSVERRYYDGAKLTAQDEETFVHADERVEERRAAFVRACQACREPVFCEKEARDLQAQPDVARFWTSCP